MPRPKPTVSLVPVAETDFEQLADLRVAAMHESLERLGRFDPERARERLRNSFSPEHTRFIFHEDEVVGFCAARPTADGLQLDHLYVHPDHQNRGIGAVVLSEILEEADRAGQSVRVGALRDSPSNRFYQRYGFVKTHETAWDICYIRLHRSTPGQSYPDP